MAKNQVEKQLRDEKLQGVLRAVREIEIRRDERVEAYRQKIEEVKSDCASETAPYRNQLHEMMAQAALEEFGIKVGDIVECWIGWRRKQTRKYRIDAIIAEPRFFEYDGHKSYTCDFTTLGTCIKKDGSEGESNIRIYEGDIIKSQKATD